jgi:uncharacterized protein (DUF58 family)
MRLRGFLAALAAALALAGCAGQKFKLAKAPSHSEARPANPNGSVLVPVRETPAVSLLSDDILPSGKKQPDDKKGSMRPKPEDQ